MFPNPISEVDCNEEVVVFSTTSVCFASASDLEGSGAVIAFETVFSGSDEMIFSSGFETTIDSSFVTSVSLNFC